MGKKGEWTAAEVEECEQLRGEIEALFAWFSERWKQVLTRQGLTQREYEDLLVVAAHPKSQLGEVALEMDRSDAQTGRGLKKLGEREWVVLEQEARDKRRTRVEVTAAGRQLLENCEGAKKQLTAALGVQP